MAQIKIPPYNWFINKSDNKPVTNVYTGSCDTEAKKGTTHKTTFNYKVYVVDVGTETEKFVAECYSITSLNDGYKKEEIGTKDATCSDDGLIVLNEWLNEEHNKFLEN